MGSWTDGQCHLWKWFYAPAEDRLYEKQADTWNVYSMEGGRTQRTNKRFWFQGNGNACPSYSLQATVFSLDPGHFMLSNYGWDATPPLDDNPTSLTEAIA